MELIDILPKEGWRQLEQNLFSQFQLNCTVYNSSGVGITGKPQWCNRLCPEIKANKNSLASICAPGNQYFMAQAKATRKPVIEECDAGLIKIAVPIFVGDEFLGTAGGCGQLPVGGEVEIFLIEKTTGLSEDEISSLCEGINTMTREKAETMAAYIQEQLSQYVDDYQSQLKRNPVKIYA